VVAPPATVCGVRPHRLLRQLARPARHCACDRFGSPGHLQLRAGRGLVLELPNKRIHGRTWARTPAASSARPTRTWPSRTGPRQLAGPVVGFVTLWAATSSGTRGDRSAAKRSTPRFGHIVPRRGSASELFTTGVNDFGAAKQFAIHSRRVQSVRVLLWGVSRQSQIDCITRWGVSIWGMCPVSGSSLKRAVRMAAA
jgi:hypothetical protein